MQATPFLVLFIAAALPGVFSLELKTSTCQGGFRRGPLCILLNRQKDTVKAENVPYSSCPPGETCTGSLRISTDNQEPYKVHANEGRVRRRIILNKCPLGYIMKKGNCIGSSKPIVKQQLSSTYHYGGEDRGVFISSQRCPNGYIRKVNVCVKPKPIPIRYYRRRRDVMGPKVKPCQDGYMPIQALGSTDTYCWPVGDENDDYDDYGTETEEYDTDDVMEVDEEGGMEDETQSSEYSGETVDRPYSLHEPAETSDSD